MKRLPVPLFLLVLAGIAGGMVAVRWTHADEDDHCPNVVITPSVVASCTGCLSDDEQPVRCHRCTFTVTSIP